LNDYEEGGGSFMSEKRTRASEIKTEQNCIQLPDWYWTHGLHDAVILSASELQLNPDYKEKKPKYNCLEIALDSKNAIYERGIKKICLYNYKIKTPDIDINSIDKPWWISDTLRVLENKHFLLDTEIEASDGSRVNFIVEFEFSETERE